MSSFSLSSKIRAGAAGLAGALALSGCAGYKETYAPYFAVKDGTAEKLISACMWAGDGTRITYLSDKGNTYDVRATGPETASISAILNYQTIRIQGYYNGNSLYAVNPASGEVNKLTLGQAMPVRQDMAIVIPSKGALLSPNYAFREAAQLTTQAVFFRPEMRPQQYCAPAYRPY